MHSYLKYSFDFAYLLECFYLKILILLKYINIQEFYNFADIQDL